MTTFLPHSCQELTICIHIILRDQLLPSHTSVVVRSIKKNVKPYQESCTPSVVQLLTGTVHASLTWKLEMRMETIKHRTLTEIGNAERATELMGEVSVELSVQNREPGVYLADTSFASDIQSNLNIKQEGCFFPKGIKLSEIPLWATQVFSFPLQTRGNSQAVRVLQHTVSMLAADAVISPPTSISLPSFQLPGSQTPIARSVTPTLGENILAAGRLRRP